MVDRSAKRRRRLEGHLARAGAASGAAKRAPFRRFASSASTAVGKPQAFIAALVLVIAWAAVGPVFDYSDTWQLVINTSTTIITFLMVFLIQNAQNRDTEALRLKIDELLLSIETARNEFVDLDGLTDEELKDLENEVRRNAQDNP